MLLDTNNIVYVSKGCRMCRMMRVVTIYLCKHNIKPVLAGISQHSIQSCTPLVNKQFAPGVHSDLMTG